MIDNSFNKKSFFRSKGIYILAALCILAAGAGVWGAMRVAKTPTDNNSTEHSSRQYNIDYSVPQETLTQETFFRALDGLEDYDGRQDVRAWLFTVARNAYYDHCRRAKHAAPLEDAETKAADSPDIAQLLVDKDAAFTVHQCLHALEEPYKEVFSLRVFGELPFDRIGAIFGHNAAWARVTYYRAKTRLQTMLEQRK